MFSQASVYSEEGGKSHVTITHDTLETQVSIPPASDMTSGGHYWRHRYLSPQTWDMSTPPPASMYGWQAGGTHPTGMLCCYTKFCVDL